ncbi:MAG: hypothetical protein ABIB71_08125 [Candidatus Woesearchaeota archaeon]
MNLTRKIGTGLLGLLLAGSAACSDKVEWTGVQGYSCEMTDEGDKITITARGRYGMVTKDKDGDEVMFSYKGMGLGEAVDAFNKCAQAFNRPDLTVRLRPDTSYDAGNKPVPNPQPVTQPEAVPRPENDQG